VIVKPSLRRACAIFVLILAAAAPTAAQAPQAPQARQAPQAAQDDPDLDISFVQPDFTLVALPTTLRVPRHRSAFRVTHRFTRPLGDGDFGELAEDFFGLDSGAQIGLEFRFGLFRGTQIGIHRTSDRTIEFFGQHQIKAQTESFPFAIDALATIDGTNNFKDSYSPGLGAVISRTFGEHVAFYVHPIWVNNANLQPSEVVDHNDSFVIGLGTRLRIRPTVYLVLEGAPRVAGDDPGATQVGFGLEKRSGGHMFQLTFTNGFGTTMGQIARGASNNDDWYLGFSISRKFY
jgi:hypothetical protein